MVCDGPLLFMLLRNPLQDRSQFPERAASWTHFRAPPSSWEFAVRLNHALDQVFECDVYGLNILVSELLFRM